VRLRSAVLALLLAAASARGDGGVLRLSQPAGPFEISIFTAPTPLRVGAADVSVMVLARPDREPVLDAQVRVLLRAGNLERTVAATRAAATNKLLYAAAVDIPAAGQWTLAVHVVSPAGEADVSCAVDVAPPRPPFAAFWPYLVLPAVAVALFAVHQWLKRP
jgi:hypothetical protein